MTDEYLESLIQYFNLREFFQQNSLLKLLVVAAIVFVLIIASRLLCALVQRKIEKRLRLTDSDKVNQSSIAAKDKTPILDVDIFERVIKNTRRILYLLILDWGLRQLSISAVVAEIFRIIFISLLIWAFIEFFIAFIPFNIDLYLRRHGMTLKTSQTRSLLPIIKGLVWAIGLTFLLDNLGFHVSTIIAGLGIMGVAVGLAGQAILADFFSYIVILLDKPFRIGDFVELGDGKCGDVEYMGPKTTHLRNLEDDLIVCANSEMTKGILVNQGSIHEREVILDVGVSYTTPLPLLKRLPSIFEETVNSIQNCRFDRACLLSFGSSNLKFQIIYLVRQDRNNIRQYMITRSQVNMAILDRFAAEGISMDYPTEHVLFSNLQGPKPASAPHGPEQSSSSAS